MTEERETSQIRGELTTKIRMLGIEHQLETLRASRPDRGEGAAEPSLSIVLPDQPIGGVLLSAFSRQDVSEWPLKHRSFYEYEAASPFVQHSFGQPATGTDGESWWHTDGTHDFGGWACHGPSVPLEAGRYVWRWHLDAAFHCPPQPDHAAQAQVWADVVSRDGYGEHAPSHSLPWSAFCEQRIGAVGGTFELDKAVADIQIRITSRPAMLGYPGPCTWRKLQLYRL